MVPPLLSRRSTVVGGATTSMREQYLDGIKIYKVYLLQKSPMASKQSLLFSWVTTAGR
jgi:hypothetical protein